MICNGLRLLKYIRLSLVLLMNLTDKVCLITGGTRGIGAATAIELARRGADIALNGLQEDSPEDVMSEIKSLGRRCVNLVNNMAKPEEAIRCVDQTVKQFGAIDVLIHTAGGAVPGTLLDTTPEDWYRAFDIHVHALFHLCRAAVPVMKSRGEGAIVMIGSAAGTRGCPTALPYGVVKGALPQFARALARQLADDNIRVNCVSPGVIRTRFQDNLTPEQIQNNIQNRIPLHREGKPEEVAQVITLLVENDYLTGENIHIDGGLTMRIV